MSSTDNISALAQELGIHRDLLYRWRGQVEAIPAVETPASGTVAEIRAMPSSEKRTAYSRGQARCIEPET